MTKSEHYKEFIKDIELDYFYDCREAGSEYRQDQNKKRYLDAIQRLTDLRDYKYAQAIRWYGKVT